MCSRTCLAPRTKVQSRHSVTYTEPGSGTAITSCWCPPSVRSSARGAAGVTICDAPAILSGRRPFLPESSRLIAPMLRHIAVSQAGGRIG